MMADGIRIDALPTTAIPSRDHVLPAMNEGLSVRLTVAQILGLIIADDLDGKVLPEGIPWDDDTWWSDLGNLKDVLINIGEWIYSIQNDAWGRIPIGVTIPLFDHISGVSAPPIDQDYRFIKLTAGETGPGGYNEGVLDNESVSGSAPLVVATAEIVLAGSPMIGETIPLINTEGRFLRAGTTSGQTQDDAFQGHWHAAVRHNLRHTDVVVGGEVILLNQPDGVNSDASEAGVRTAMSDGTNGTPRTANETRPRNTSVNYYMRIF